MTSPALICGARTIDHRNIQFDTKDVSYFQAAATFSKSGVLGFHVAAPSGLHGGVLSGILFEGLQSS